MSLGNTNKEEINYQTDVNEIITTVSSYTVPEANTGVKKEVDFENQQIRREASNLADRIMSDIKDITEKEELEKQLQQNNEAQAKISTNSEVVTENIGKVKQIRKMFDKPHTPGGPDQFQIGSTFHHRRVYYCPSPAKTDSLPRPPPVDQLEKQTQDTYRATVPKSASVLQIRQMFETRDISNIQLENRSNSNIDITSETKIECVSPELRCSTQNLVYIPCEIQSSQCYRSLSPLDIHSSVKFHECPAHSTPKKEFQNQYKAKLVMNDGGGRDSDERMTGSQLPYRSRSLSRSPSTTRARSGSLTQRCISPIPINYLENRGEQSQVNESYILSEPLEKPSAIRSYEAPVQPDQMNCEKSLQSYEEDIGVVSIPDGVYVRTGEVYEKLDERNKRGPLGHWITTIVNKKRDECYTTPVTQVTNIWMNSEDRPSRDRLVLTENNNLGSRNYRTSNQYSSMDRNHSRSGTHSPTCHLSRWPFNSSMPPYRTQHLRSWGSEANCSSNNRKYGPSPAICYKSNGTRNRTKNVYFERNRSPTPLFHSPEQVERRIRELKADRNEDQRNTEDGRGAWLQELESKSQNRLARSTSTSPCLGKRAEIIHSIRFADQTNDYEAQQQLENFESGIDCSPISNDFVTKCAYFEDITREGREIFLSDRCTCNLHCPKVRINPDPPMPHTTSKLVPKRSSSVCEMRNGEYGRSSLTTRHRQGATMTNQPQTIRQFKRVTLQNHGYPGPGETHNYTIQTNWRPGCHTNIEN